MTVFLGKITPYLFLRDLLLKIKTYIIPEDSFIWVCLDRFLYVDGDISDYVFLNTVDGY